MFPVGEAAGNMDFQFISPSADGEISTRFYTQKGRALSLPFFSFHFVILRIEQQRLVDAEPAALFEQSQLAAPCDFKELIAVHAREIIDLV